MTLRLAAILRLLSVIFGDAIGVCVICVRKLSQRGRKALKASVLHGLCLGATASS